MSASDYSSARKSALKAFRQDIASGHHPYLQVLDELLPFAHTCGEQDLGLIEIPIDRIVGTKTAGRTRAFASNFMPLLEEGSEFATKWSALFESHLEEGIREPVIACEFMNSYYIIEGNKRVSVLKYTGAVSVLGYVTRIVPEMDGSREVKVYYEYMDFFRFSGINTVYFSRPGSFRRLCKLVGKPFGETWSEDERRTFSSALLYFSEVYQKRGGAKIPVTTGDAFLVYLDVYGYEGLIDKSNDTIRKELTPLWDDIEALPQAENVNVVMQPDKTPEPSIIRKLVPSAKLKVAFLYYKTADTSSWTYSHDLGRRYLEENLGDRLEIHVYDGILDDEGCAAKIEEAIADGCTVIFTASSRFLGASIRVGMKYPQIRMFNCSLNTYTGHLKTYYGRLYEAKFLVGMLAGILTDTDRIGYIADFPIFGTTASINAFALGVRMVNPSARVHLAWTSAKEFDSAHLFDGVNVSHICGNDSIAPQRNPRLYGLYRANDTSNTILAASIWHWGKFYQRILLTILNGGQKLPVRLAPAGSARRADMTGSVSYWWGISSGMIDLITSNSIPERTRTLVNLVRRQIENGEFQIFSGDLYDQEKQLRTVNGAALMPQEIITMDWLADNIVGRIPGADELVASAIPMIQLQGIYSNREEL